MMSFHRQPHSWSARATGPRYVVFKISKRNIQLTFFNCRRSNRNKLRLPRQIVSQPSNSNHSGEASPYEEKDMSEGSDDDCPSLVDETVTSGTPIGKHNRIDESLDLRRHLDLGGGDSDKDSDASSYEPSDHDSSTVVGDVEEADVGCKLLILISFLIYIN